MKFIAVCCRMARLLLPLLWFWSTATAGEMQGVIMPLSNPDRPITVQRGETFAVVVPANQTTGYSWQLAAPPDELVLKLIATEYLGAASQLDGAGGREVWRFAAVQAGRTIVSLKYVRPWAKNFPPTRTVEFTIIVL